MISTNNYIPTIVEKSVRQAVKITFFGGAKAMRYYKRSAHRSYRRKMNQHIHNIESQNIDCENYNDEPGHCRLTSWDIC